MNDEVDIDTTEIAPRRERLLDILLGLEPEAFERLCQRILREAGFIKVEVTGRSGDGGIDGTGVLRVNLLSFHVLSQSKRWKGSVGTSVVRDFRGAMVGRADKGLILTTGTFTAAARGGARRRAYDRPDRRRGGVRPLEGAEDRREGAHGRRR